MDQHTMYTGDWRIIETRIQSKHMQAGSHRLHVALPLMSDALKPQGINGSVSASQKALSIPFKIPCMCQS